MPVKGHCVCLMIDRLPYFEGKGLLDEWMMDRGVRMERHDAHTRALLCTNSCEMKSHYGINSKFQNFIAAQLQ